MNTTNKMNTNFILGVKHQIALMWSHFVGSIENNPATGVFMTLFGALIQFILKSISVDIWLIFFLVGLNIVNTITGIKKAKKEERETGEKVYSDKILLESIKHKWTGYTILLCALGMFMGMLFIVSSKEGSLLVSEYWLNLPVMLMLVFFNAMEFKSILQNAKILGWHIPIFVETMPDKVIEKVNEVAGNTKINKNNVERNN